ncbi:MAG: 7-cyano-7-deazaguanine synthase [Candidatus Shapirobacteria bacterium]|jgi:7-cyano-7-deazaguanine synthase
MEIKTKMNVDLLAGLSRKRTKKVVLLFSGGIDSLGVGLLLKDKKFKIYPLFLDYGQTASVAEQYLVEKVPSLAGFEPTKVIKTDLMHNLSKSRLLGQESVNDDDAWVPGRNTLFMTIAGIYAQQIDADGIAIGYMKDDNFVFGDNDYFHHLEVAQLLSKSFLRPMKVYMPAIAKTKLDLIKLIKSKNLLEATTSCWNAKLENDQIIECGLCANCLEKKAQLSSR